MDWFLFLHRLWRWIRVCAQVIHVARAFGFLVVWITNAVTWLCDLMDRLDTDNHL